MLLFINYIFRINERKYSSYIIYSIFLKGYNTETIKAFIKWKKKKFTSETIKEQQHLLIKIGKI